MDNRYFSDKIVEWYLSNKRDLPWRETNDPYKIWLSEIILQQTRVSQGLPYYRRFIDQFPDVQSLALASEQEVLRLWQGLGYYTRARNLHKCAKEVVSHYGGNFPTTFENLLKLPGIGEYTAAAIASFCYNEPVAVLDGNVFRVLSRLFGIEKEINSPQGKKIFTTLANDLISQTRPDLHNQAIMEFGALRCIPKNPLCSSCCFRSACVAAQNNLQEILPRKGKSKTARKRYFYYLVVQKGKSLLMKRRLDKDIWEGLYDFMLRENKRPIKTEKLLDDLNLSFKDVAEVKTIEVSKLYKHILTHQVIFSKFIIISVGKVYGFNDNLKFYTFEKIHDLPKPRLITRFLSDHKNLL
jgi:A/G-specific adenine glycosylase